MSFFRRRATRQCLVATILAVSTLVAGAFAGPARAADENNLGSSLMLVPDNVAFYGSMLRNREQLDTLLKSKALAKLKAIPAIQQAWGMAQAQLAKPSDPQAAAALQMLNAPENQELLQLLGDMVSNEVFCYGGDSLVGLTDLIGQVIGAARYGPALAALSGEGGDPSKAQARMALNALSQNLELIKMPEFVLGFKLSKSAPAEAQLKRLEELLKGLAQQAPPPLRDGFKRESVGGGSFLTLTLDGSLVPWDQIPIGNFEEKAGEFAKLMEKLKKLKLTICLGVKNDCLLLAIGGSTDLVAKFGAGNALGGRPELKVLAKHAGQRVTGVSYTSKAIKTVVSTSKKDMDGLADMAQEFLKKADLPAAQIAKIHKDLLELSKDFQQFMPELGASVEVSYLNGRGHETFGYDWGKYPTLEASRPLGLLNHVGGSPILAIVGRQKYSPENYKKFVGWIKTAHKYFEEIVPQKLDENQKGQYEQVTKMLFPLLARLETVTGTLFLPSLADSQSAFVIDGKLTSSQLHKTLPKMDKPMPVPELALVMSVSDAASLKKAMSEYRAIVNEIIGKIREINPQVPEFQIPEPATKSAKSGTIYYYPLPEEAGVDMRVSPNAGLSDKVAVLSLSHSHSDRVLASTPLKIDGGPLADLAKPRSSAVYFSWEAFINTASPWIDFGVRTAVAQGGGGGLTPEAILDQIKTVVEVLKCFKSFASSTYVEDGVVVTHSETVMKDL